MENTLGKLSSAVRSKDAEIESMQNALHEQFEERNGLRAHLSGVDSQLIRLQGSYVELEARLRDSEEMRMRLQGAQQRCASESFCQKMDWLCVWVSRHRHVRHLWELETVCVGLYVVRGLG